MTPGRNLPQRCGARPPASLLAKRSLAIRRHHRRTGRSRCIHGRYRRYWEERVATLERQIDHYRAVESARLRGGGAFPELNPDQQGAAAAAAAAAAVRASQPRITVVNVPLVPSPNPQQSFVVHPAEARYFPTLFHVASPRSSSNLIASSIPARNGTSSRAVVSLFRRRPYTSQSEALRQRISSGWFHTNHSAQGITAARLNAARPAPSSGQVLPGLTATTEQQGDPLASAVAMYPKAGQAAATNVSAGGGAGGGNGTAAADLGAPPAPLEAVARLVSQSLAYPDSPASNVRFDPHSVSLPFALTSACMQIFPSAPAVVELASAAGI